MQEFSPASPEARRRRPVRGTRLSRRLAFMAPGSYAREVATRVAMGVMSDGFIHAGNLAYLSLVALFPFCIVAAAVARLFGRTGAGQRAVELFLENLPADVAAVLKAPIAGVVAAPSGTLAWFGALVGLWTTASFVETIRDILRRAYGVESVRPFWQHRLWSIALVLASLILALIAFSFQVTLVAAEQFIVRTMPFAKDAAMIVSVSRLAPALALVGALYLLFYTLTPREYRESRAPKWPGALFTAAWWLGVTAMLPVQIAHFASYNMIYGSLAGVMIALIFFFLIGWGLVVGAQLNAALAEADEQGVGSGNDANRTQMG